MNVYWVKEPEDEFEMLEATTFGDSEPKFVKGLKKEKPIGHLLGYPIYTTEDSTMKLKHIVSHSELKEEELAEDFSKEKITDFLVHVKAIKKDFKKFYEAEVKYSKRGRLIERAKEDE